MKAKKAAKTTTKAKTTKTFCKMCPTWEIKNPDRCSNTYALKTKTYYFCTKRCKDRFLKKEGLE